MANEEHLEIFKQGAKVWNKWRKEAKVKPDLSGAKLSTFNLEPLDDMDLSRMNLSEVKLDFVTLIRVCFVESNLNNASCFGGDFSGGDFNNANLSGANFNYAEFDGANLSEAFLISTNLIEAMLDSANFSGAQLGGTIFANNDLSSAKGLDSVVHRAPSTIGIDTLYRSGGKIPASFLRGCGAPDEFIAYLPSLIGAQQAIQFYSCFISYSSKDEEFCKRLHARMRDEHLRVWFAPEDVKGGEKLYEQIDRAIQMHDRLLIVLSEESLKSKWVMTEIRRARKTELREGRRKLFPIRLCSYEQLRDWKCFDADSGEDLAVEVREYFIPDFSNWKDHDAFESAFDKLLKDLRAAEGSGKADS
jgi:hypothetical protein